jgi:2',3'-cyclic-nucleotide 2'-phosphodiesterase (5'-nucleotidase family)
MNPAFGVIAPPISYTTSPWTRPLPGSSMSAGTAPLALAYSNSPLQTASSQTTSINASPQPSSVKAGSASAAAYPVFTNEKAVPANWKILDILHVNDQHEGFSVLPSLVTGVRQLEAEAKGKGHAVLKVNSGDNNTGGELKDWLLNQKVLNTVGFDGATFGNHEFDLGVPTLSKTLPGFNFPWVSCNLQVPAEADLNRVKRPASLGTASKALSPQQGWEPHSLVLEKGGLKIGFTGAMTPELGEYASSKINMQGVKAQPFEQTAQSLQREIDALKARGVDVIVSSTHVGLETDRDLIDPARGGVTGYGSLLTIGGHSHTELPKVEPAKNYVTDKLGNPVLIAQTGSNAHFIGHTEVAVSPEGKVVPIFTRLIPANTFAPDPVVSQMIAAEKGQNPEIAKLDRPYSLKGHHWKEDPVGNLVADELWQEANTQGRQADFAILRSGCIRDSIGVGGLSKEDLKVKRLECLEVLPFMNPMVIASVTGAQLLEALQSVAEGQAKRSDHPGLFSPSQNFRYTLDLAQGKVVSADLKNRQTGQWEPVNPRRTYNMAIDDYATHSKEYPMWKGLPAVSTLPVSMAELFRRGLTDKQALTPNRPISFGPEGRIRFVGKASQPIPMEE